MDITNMNTDLFFVGVILLIMAFAVGIRKQTWLLAGFNEKRVDDKQKLAKLVGIFTGAMGFIFMIAGIISFTYIESLYIVLVVGYVSLIIYVNVRMVR